MHKISLFGKFVFAVLFVFWGFNAVLVSAQTTQTINRSPARLFGLTVDESSFDERKKDESIKKIIDELLNLKKQNLNNDSLTVRFVLPVTCKREISNEECGEYGDTAELTPGYVDLLKEAHKHFVVMAEIMDSDKKLSGGCFVDDGGHPTKEVSKLNSDKSKECYQARTSAFYEKIGDFVDIWEFGNEVNGQWFGGESGNKANYQTKQKIVWAQLESAYSYLRGKNAKTAITYYFNNNLRGDTSYDFESEDMMKWIKKGGGKFKDVDYVLLSYYPDDNDDIELNFDGWNTVFTLIRNNYKKTTKFGIGEMGTHCKIKKCDRGDVCEKSEDNPAECNRNSSCCRKAQIKIITDYYSTLDRNIRRALQNTDLQKQFIGGYFYWFYSEDVINKPPDSEGETKTTRKAVWNVFSGWNQPIDSASLSITADSDNNATAPEIKILQPGDTSKTNPYTIVIMNNPAITSEDGLNRDPINDAREKFDKSTDYIYANLFAKLPGQAENFLADKSIADKIRVVSLWINAPADESHSFIEIKGQFQARQTAITIFFADLNKKYPDLNVNPDVVLAVTGWEHIYKATAFAAREENCRNGIKFWFDKNSYTHCFTSDQPGAVAINVEDDSMTALHEFSHAASSYYNGYVDDLDGKELKCNCRLTVNKKRKGWFERRKEFAIYYLDGADPNDPKNHYALDKSETRTEKGIFAPVKINPEFPALMDNYHEAKNGNAEKCRHDQLTSQFLLDRIRAKTMR